MASRHFSFKTGKVGAGGKHSRYIAGEGRYAERDDVRLVIDRNLPGWANSAEQFFEAADRHERVNGRAYSEIEFAIPREVADPIEYAEKYAENLLGDRHVYRLAVHDKPAADGGRNVHGHLMFTERKLDGIERSEEQFFKRANTKHPERGGAAKDRSWHDRERINTLRRDYEAHAKAHGVALDLRSNKEQGLGLAEPKIGPQKIRHRRDTWRDGRQEEVARIREIREESAELEKGLADKRAQLELEKAATEKLLANHSREAQNAIPPRLKKRVPRRVEVELDQEQERRRAAWHELKQQRRDEWWSSHLTTTPQHPVTNRVVWRYKSGRAAVVDYGSHIKPAGNPEKLTPGKVGALLHVAKQKGWSEINISGPAAFRLAVAIEADKQGIGLTDPDLKQYIADRKAQEQQAKLEAQARADQARAEREAAQMAAYQAEKQKAIEERWSKTRRSEEKKREMAEFMKAQMEALNTHLTPLSESSSKVEDRAGRSPELPAMQPQTPDEERRHTRWNQALWSVVDAANLSLKTLTGCWLIFVRQLTSAAAAEMVKQPEGVLLRSYRKIKPAWEQTPEPPKPEPVQEVEIKPESPARTAYRRKEKTKDRGMGR